MSAAVMNGGPGLVQYNPGMQFPQQNNNATMMLQMLVTLLSEFQQLLQTAEQGGQQGGQGGQPGAGAQPGGAPVAGGGAQPGAVGGTQPGVIGGGGQQFNAQSASGALSSYMSANGVQSLNPSQLYQLAYNPQGNATPTDSAAAKWMLQNPSVFNQIETHDVPGSDGIAGVNDFQWAAQGGMGNAGGTGTTPSFGGGTPTFGGGMPQMPTGGTTGGGMPQQGPTITINVGGNTPQTPAFTMPQGGGTLPHMGPGLALPPQNGGAQQMNTQSASGALASYMSANNVQSLNPNQLYQLAYNPPANATPTDSSAAKFMLQNSSVFNQIETHDVAGSDGIAGVNDFQWAAQGGG